MRDSFIVTFLEGTSYKEFLLRLLLVASFVRSSSPFQYKAAAFAEADDMTSLLWLPTP